MPSRYSSHAVELLDHGRAERDLRGALVNQVEHRAVAGDLGLGAVLRRGLLRDERLDALARRDDLLDRVGSLGALDPSDVDQGLQELRALHPERVLAPARGIDGAQGTRDGGGHEADLVVKDAERVHRNGSPRLQTAHSSSAHCAV